MITVTVERQDGRSPLVVEHAELVAEVYFRLDPAARPGGYDDYIARHPGSNVIDSEDIGVINRTMRARTPVAEWETLFSEPSHSWLAKLSTEWDLLAMDDPAWQARGCSDALRAAFRGIQAPYPVQAPWRGRAVATKLLHLKRPALVPVCDSLVEAHLGVPSSIDALALVELIRTEGRRNLAGLCSVQAHLRGSGIDRTLIRVFDGLLWSTHPSSELAPVRGLISDWADRGVIRG